MQRRKLQGAACQRHAGEPFEPRCVAEFSGRSPATRCVAAPGRSRRPFKSDHHARVDETLNPLTFRVKSLKIRPSPAEPNQLRTWPSPSAGRRHRSITYDLAQRVNPQPLFGNSQPLVMTILNQPNVHNSLCRPATGWPLRNLLSRRELRPKRVQRGRGWSATVIGRSEDVSVSLKSGFRWRSAPRPPRILSLFTTLLNAESFRGEFRSPR